MNIKRYTIYCAYTNRNPAPELVEESAGMWVWWEDHEDVVNKLKNCGNCAHNIGWNPAVLCEDCYNYENWKIKE